MHGNNTLSDREEILRLKEELIYKREIILALQRRLDNAEGRYQRGYERGLKDAAYAINRLFDTTPED